MKRFAFISIAILCTAAMAYAQADEETGADAAVEGTEETREEQCEDLPPAEVTFLKALRDRQRELQEREARVAQREEELRKRESEFRKRIEEAEVRLEKLEAVAEAGEKGREAREARVLTLAKAIESLSAKKAAPMLATVDKELARELLVRLPPKQFGALLQAMPPERAADLMQEVAQVAEPKTQGRRK